MTDAQSFQRNAAVTNDDLNDLFAASWTEHAPSDFQHVLKHSLGWVCAFADARLIGFVNIATDGGAHAFVLDTTVHPDFRRRGVGRRLVAEAVEMSRERGVAWVRVDFEPDLTHFYFDDCGFRATAAGVMKLR